MSDARRAPLGSGAFLEWASTLDARWVRATYWPRGWLVAGAVLALLLVGVARVPPAREYFALQLGPALALQALVLALALACFEVDTRWGLSIRARARCVCALGFFYQLHASSLVSLSEPPGAFVLATFPILAAWGQCATTRSTPRHPYVALAQAAGLVAALGLRPQPATAVVLAVVAIVGLSGGLLLGLFLSRANLHLADLDAQRAAIVAQSLAAGVAERDRAAAVLAGALEREREAREALADARRACERLETSALCQTGPAPRPELRDALQLLRESLAQLAAGRDPLGGEAGAATPEPPATTAVWLGVRTAVAEAAARAPHVRLTGRVAAPGLERAAACVAGGAEGLRQILDNLIANACEGDGVRGPRRVAVELSEEDGGSALSIRVADDGPGFSPARLAGAIAPFHSSKPEGTGLGLYIAERLAHASGGELRRRNLDTGGAEVVVQLRRAPVEGVQPGAAS